MFSFFKASLGASEMLIGEDVGSFYNSSSYLILQRYLRLFHILA